MDTPITAAHVTFHIIFGFLKNEPWFQIKVWKKILVH